eukprot:c9606_g1_i1.p1 GENE.c9606_g1_i1~~c9606_g1_i1.p1  ORF type:complete len:499 (-),score=128.84 c9606_g1_i1:650-2146(-)
MRWACLCLCLIVMGGEAVTVSNRIQIENSIATVRKAIDTTVTALQLSTAADQITISDTWVDQGVHTIFGSGEGGYDLLRRVITFGMYGLVAISAVLIVTSLLATMVTGKRQADRSRVVSLVYWMAWTGVGLFIVLTGLQVIVFNRVYDLSTSSASLGSSSGMPFLLQTLSTMMSSILDSSKKDDSPTQPVFCSLTWSTSDASLNLYPPGTPVYEYNMERLHQYSGDSAEISRLKASLVGNNTAQLGTQAAKTIGIISNACEEEDGNIDRCCDETLCRFRSDPVACFENRCPGKAFSQSGYARDSHCQCLDTMTQIGYPVPRQHLSLCVTEQYTENKRTIMKTLGRNDPAIDDPSCLGVFDGKLAAISGPLKKQMYTFGNFEDAGMFGSQSLFIKPTSSDGSGAQIEYTLKQCSRPKIVLTFRYMNLGTTDRTMELWLDGKFETQLVFPASGSESTRVWAANVTHVLSGVLPGSHVLSLKASSGGVAPPWLHTLKLESM